MNTLISELDQIYLCTLGLMDRVAINKAGYGNACAWLCTPDISLIKV